VSAADNPNAFPACNEANVNGTMGMTLRDWFAGQALAGMCASYPEYERRETLDQTRGGKRISEAAYVLADAMLAARAQASL
jgi:hypothetical protein